MTLCDPNERLRPDIRVLILYPFVAATICLHYDTNHADGTGASLKQMRSKSLNEDISNVLKLHFLAGGDINNKRNDVDGQVCFYVRGHGTMSNNPLRKVFNKFAGILSKQTKPMHKRLDSVYTEGDEIYIIGFSRGAASARRFCCELEEKGVGVKFLGCFDTVSDQFLRHPIVAVTRMLPNKLISSDVLKEKNGKIAKNVRTAVHSISLDDSRRTFPLIHMGSNDPKVFESYFPGSHSMVGGGYYFNGVSDACGKHMQDWLKEEGVTFLDYNDVHPECLQRDDDPNVKVDEQNIQFDPDPEEPDSWERNYLPSRDRRVCSVANNEIIDGGRVKIDQSVLRHLESRADKDPPYKPNPNLKSANFVVTGHLGEELPEETEKLRNLLK